MKKNENQFAKLIAEVKKRNNQVKVSNKKTNADPSHSLLNNDENNCVDFKTSKTNVSDLQVPSMDPINDSHLKDTQDFFGFDDESSIINRNESVVHENEESEEEIIDDVQSCDKMTTKSPDMFLDSPSPTPSDESDESVSLLPDNFSQEVDDDLISCHQPTPDNFNALNDINNDNSNSSKQSSSNSSVHPSFDVVDVVPENHATPIKMNHLYKTQESVECTKPVSPLIKRRLTRSRSKHVNAISKPSISNLDFNGKETNLLDNECYISDDKSSNTLSDDKNEIKNGNTGKRKSNEMVQPKEKNSMLSQCKRTRR